MSGAGQGCQESVSEGIRLLPQRQEVTGEFKLTQTDSNGEITVTIKGRAESAEELIVDFRDRLYGVASWIENAYDMHVDAECGDFNIGPIEEHSTIRPE